MGFFKNAIFRFKLGLSKKNSSISEIFTSSDVLAKKDDDLAENLITVELDEEKVAAFRKQNSQDISNLRRAIYQEGLKNKGEILDKIDKDSIEYVKYLSRELKDIEKIIDLSSKLIDNERLSLMYDVRRPLGVFAHYRQSFVKVFKKIGIEENVKNSIVNILVDIGKQYDLIIRHTMDLANRIHMVGVPSDSEGLVKAIHDRTIAKKRLSGKTTSIINQIKKLEYYFKEFKKYKVLNEEEAEAVLQNLKNFREVFSQLTTFCKNRIDASGIIIMEANLLQKNKLEELKILHEEIKKLSDDLKSISKDEKNHKSEMIKRSLSLLKSYDKQVKTLEKKDKNVMRREERIERLLVNRLNNDEKRFEREQNDAISQLNKTSQKLDKFRKASLTWIAIGLMSFQAAAPSLSFVYQNVKKDNKITVVGTHEQIKNELKTMDVDYNIKENNLLVNEVVTQNIVQDFPRTFSSDFYEFKFVNNNKERQIVNLEESFHYLFQNESEKAVNVIKNKVYKALKDTNMSEEEKDAIVSEAINHTLSFNGEIISTACILNATLNSQNNKDLAMRSAKKALENFAEAARTSGFRINEESLSNIKIATKEVRRHSQVKKVVDKLNNFMNSGRINETRLDTFFGSNPQYLEYRNLLNEKIDYQKLAGNDNNEYIKFNIVAQILKYYFLQEYREIQEILNETRKIQIRINVNISLVIYGESDIPLISFNPIGNMHSHPAIPHYKGGKVEHIKQWKQGEVRKGYKGKFFIGIPRGESKMHSGPKHVNRAGRR